MVPFSPRAVHEPARPRKTHDLRLRSNILLARVSHGGANPMGLSPPRAHYFILFDDYLRHLFTIYMFGRALAQSAVDRKLDTTAEADYSCVCGWTREKFDLKYTPFYTGKKNHFLG